jgi:hypothetical protein
MQTFQLPPLDRILDLARQRPDFPKVHVSEFLKSIHDTATFLPADSYSSDSIEDAQNVSEDDDYIKVGPWSPEEDSLLKRLILEHGRTWKTISDGIPGRNVSQCKKRYQRMKQNNVVQVQKSQRYELSCTF